MNNEPKALPSLPSLDYDSSPKSRRFGQLTRLTIEGRAHQKKFIKYALQEESVRSVEDWLIGIEFALQELVENIARGDWLSELAKARRIRNAKTRAEDIKLRELERKRNSVRQERQEKVDGKGKSKIREDVSSSTDEKKELDGVKRSMSLTGTAKERKLRSLNHLHKLASSTQETAADPESKFKRLLLTLSPEGAMTPMVETRLDFLSSRKVCTFTPGTFSIPMNDSTENLGPSVLYSQDGWDEISDDAILIGGTFAFRGIATVDEYLSLAKILRLSVYMRLSLILEQELLTDSHVHLNFPAILSQPMTYSYTTAVDNPVIEAPLRTPKGTVPGSLWSFLTRKTGNLLNRASRSVRLPISAVEYKRSGSLDFSSDSSSVSRRSSLDQWVQSSPPEPRERHYSLTSFSKPVFANDKPLPEVFESTALYTSALKRVVSWSEILSTSPGIIFGPPMLLTSLAEKEKKDPQRRLTAEEKMTLNGLLGWEGRRNGAKEMAGLNGFIHHQSITCLCTRHTHKTAANKDQSSDEREELEQGQTSSGSAKLCGRAHWRTYRYYSHERLLNESLEICDYNLGEFIERLCSNEPNECSVVNCDVDECDHERVWCHGGVRISCKVSDAAPSERTGNIESIRMWESCIQCKKSTSIQEMSNGTYLFSFSKYLELLLYSPFLCRFSSELCEHTALPNPTSTGELPTSRFNIARHFSFGSRVMNLNLAPIPVIYEFHLPHLRVSRNFDPDVPFSSLSPAGDHNIPENGRNGDEEKRCLKREMRAWWQVLSDHMEKLEKSIDKLGNTYHKSLPRLPSIDGQFTSADDDDPATPKAHLLDLPPLPPSAPNSPSLDSSTPRSEKFFTPYLRSSDSATLESNTSFETLDIPSLLYNLRHTFQQEEQSLYTLVSEIPFSNLNDARRTFSSTARGAALRLSAWQVKHTSNHKVLKSELTAALETVEPEWWRSNCHAVPGGNVVVREAEWASIIAFTLSSIDYQRELNSNNKSKANPIKIALDTESSSTPVSTPKGTPSSFTTGPFRAFKSSQPSPDPDADGHVWYTLESCTSTITRQDRDAPGGLFTPSRFVPSRLVGIASPGGRSVSLGTPPSAWAKPAVEVSMQAADGKVNGLPEMADTAEKLLQEKMDLSSEPTGLATQLSNSLNASQTSLDGKTSNLERASLIVPLKKELLSKDIADLRGRAAQMSLKDYNSRSPSNTSTDTLPNSTMSSRQSSLERALKNIDGLPVELLKPSEGSSASSFNDQETTSKQTHGSTSSLETMHGQQPSSATGTTTASLTSALTNAMRYLLNTTDTPKPVSPAHHHKLLAAADAYAIEARPHIKYEWTIGKRLRFSCIVYYAKEFEILRRRFGMEDIMLKSLERSENWSAEGGKSRSNFWKTTDNRFVIKTLVNAWNVADLQVLIDIAPSYFKYLESAASKPSIIAKLLGFYTIEIKNLETGNTQAKADLLVMENLFYGHSISKAFDLKGIQGRKVKSDGSLLSHKTLYDSEWIEEQQRMTTLIQPHSKLVLNEAIKADAEFLSKANIMDYSLLLGIDEERGQIACGLVDCIGSYTFAKTLEYKAKHNLKSGKEVTVIPPAEYQRRFVAAIDSYFFACPDKWSRPTDEHFSDNRTLPSIL